MKRGPQRKRGPPPEIKKKLDYKWCNQSYSGALFVNKISLYFFGGIFVVVDFFPNPEQLAAMQ